WRVIIAHSSERVARGQLPAEMSGFQKVAMSRFLPLRVCSRSVVDEFAKTTHKLDLMYLYGHMGRQQARPAAAPAKAPAQTNQHLMPPSSAAVNFTRRAVPGYPHTSSLAGSPMSATMSSPAVTALRTRMTSPLLSGTADMAISPALDSPMSLGDSISPVMAAGSRGRSGLATGLPSFASAAGGSSEDDELDANGDRTRQRGPPAISTGQGEDAGATASQWAEAASASSSTGGFLNPAECLEAFFPFDPCRLVMTKNRVDEHYIVWNGGEDDEAESGLSGLDDESDVDFMSTSLDP
ncbi:hypothetical protein HDU96_002427, partial [Phlyctochytrium bullatum]